MYATKICGNAATLDLISNELSGINAHGVRDGNDLLVITSDRDVCNAIRNRYSVACESAAFKGDLPADTKIPTGEIFESRLRKLPKLTGKAANTPKPAPVEVASPKGTATRYMELFSPRLDRYGWSRPLYNEDGTPQLKDKGADGQKHVWDSKAGLPSHPIVEKFPTITADLIRHHLTAKLAPAADLSNVTIGATPLRTDGTVRWLCIDVDQYRDTDVQGVLDLIQALGLPIVVCRSKSGGLHLFVFFSEDVPAADAIKVGTRYKSLLGIAPGTELFPKQEQATFGGWLNLPYAGGGERYGWDADGKVLEKVEQWLVYAEGRRVTLASAQRQVPFEGGPPCLAALHGEGVKDFRNNFLFNVGVYLRLKYPDEWQTKLEAYDAEFVRYRDGHESVHTVIQSLEKQPDYFYKCTDQPLCDHCDKPVCLARPFGVGSKKLNYAELCAQLDPLPDNWAELCRFAQLSPVEFDMVAGMVHQRLRDKGHRIRLPAIRAEMVPGEPELVRDKTHHDMAKEYITDQGDPRPNGAEMTLWVPDGAVWTRRPLEKMHGEIAERFNDQNHCARKGDYRAIAQHIYDLCEDETFFDDAPVGMACPGGFWHIVDGALSNETLTTDHRKRFILSVDPEPGIPWRLLRFLFQAFKGHDPHGQIQRVQEMLGAVVLNIGYKYERAWLLHGEGNAGKSTLQRVIEHLIPAEFVTATSPVDWSREYQLAVLAGKLLNLVGELGDQYLDEVFKKVLGRDRLQGRHPTHRPIEFTCRAVHVFNSNGFPNTRDHSWGFWRRWETLGFFNPRPVGQEIRDLDAQILEELPRILHWALRGGVRLVRQNGYSPSPVHDDLISRWRRNTDSVAEWLHDPEQVVLGEQYRAGKRAAYDDYRAYCGDNNRKAVGYQKFIERLLAMQCKEVRGGDSDRARYFSGVGLSAEY